MGIIHIASAFLPQFLPCDDTNNSTHVDCRNRNFKIIPLIKSQNVTKLDLSYNHLEHIANFSLSGIPNLLSLNLSWNCPPGKVRPEGEICKLTIERNAFIGLCNLQTLSLASNSLTVVPWLPSSLKLLDLEMNNIVILGYQNVSCLVNLRELYLGMNCYYRNPCNSSFTFLKDMFKDAKSLRSLSLTFNNLTSVPIGLPPTLVYLDISENQIAEIKHSDFDNLTNLEHLDLQWNCQRCDHASQPCFPCANNSALQIHPDAFHHLKNLSILNLRGNSLSKINDSLFVPLTHLRSLDVSDNFLAYDIANGTFFSKLSRVTHLRLNYNYVPGMFFPKLRLSPAFADMLSLRYLFLDGYFFGHLDEKGIEPLIMLSDLHMITFRTNFIDQVNLTLFAKIPSLQFIDMSQNILTLAKLCEGTQRYTETSPLSLSQEITFSEHHPHWRYSMGRRDNHHTYYFDFPSCRNYNRSLDLSFNNIKGIEPEFFKGLDDIQCLNLSYNFINQRLNGNQFLHLKSLKLLDLANNRFDLYNNNSFTEIPHLEILYLNYNAFQFMLKDLCHSFDFIENMTSLTFLSLSYNTIGIRISNELRSHSLKVLVFRYNRLDIMWEGGTYTYLNIFTNLHQLEVLDISYNKLQTVPYTVIDNLPKGLKKLYITFNEITFFHWKNIGSLVSLTTLDLSHNSLDFLPNEPVNFGSNFTFLNLESNKIQTLNQAFFSNCSTLKYLIVKSNRIKLINENSLPETLLKNLQYLDASGNPFRCTCDAHWFIRFSKTAKLKFMNASGLACYLPDSKQEVSLFSIDTRSCQDINGNLAFISTASIVAFFTLFPILKKLFWWDIWYSTRILKATFRKENTSIKNPDDSEYDAFIVFDTQKYAIVDWVYNDLVSHLEGKKRKHFKLCLEERDWVVGKSRIENLCDAVYKSKKTIFVLDANGFESGLLRHTFFMAQQRLLDEKMDVTILVLLDKGIKMSKYLLSRKRMCKKSILHWPCTPQGQPYFWHSLRVLLTDDGKHWYDSKLRKSIDG